MRPTRGTSAQRRSEAAPLALVLAGWALAVAPVVHPLLAHGTPFLRAAADEGWIHHTAHGAPGGGGVPLPPAHRHAPGAPEHIQLPLLAVTPPAIFRTLVLASPAPHAPVRRPVVLPRWWSMEQPQAP
ncbi:MAG TPA: hypothetical protein VGG91_03630 [Myxococcaceae bacterium]|jgi:hypothetical protein